MRTSGLGSATAGADRDAVRVLGNLVFLMDLDRGGRSMTDDAEAVAGEVLALHPGRRVVCRDSMGRWDELRHKGGAFTGLVPWQGRGRR